MRYPKTAEMQESKAHKLRTRHGNYEQQRDKRAFDTTAQDNNVIGDYGNQNRRERYEENAGGFAESRIVGLFDEEKYLPVFQLRNQSFD